MARVNVIMKSIVTGLTFVVVIAGPNVFGQTPAFVVNNAPSSGDITDFQASGTPVVKIDSSGNVISSGNITGVNGTFNAIVSAANVTATAAGAASTAGLSVTGAPYTGGSGTTNFPQTYLNAGATGPTTFSTSGTMFGENAPSTFTGNLLDLHLNGGSSLWKVDYQGNTTAAGTISSAGSLSVGTTFSATTTCSGGVNTFTGGATAGSLKAGGTSVSTCTLTITMGVASAHGWACSVWDVSNSTNVFKESGTYTTTTVTFAASSVTSGDTIVFGCLGF